MTDCDDIRDWLPTVDLFDTAELAAQRLWDQVLSCRTAPLRIAVPGGQGGAHLAKALRLRLKDEPNLQQQLTLTFTDERWVTLDDPNSNQRQWMVALADTFPAKHWVSFRDAGESRKQACVQLTETFRSAPLDVIILGVGEDGHVASLFPNTPDTDSNNLCITTDEANTPAIPRLSLSWHAIAAQTANIFLFFGGRDKLNTLIRRKNASGAAQMPVERVLALRPDVCPIVFQG